MKEQQKAELLKQIRALDGVEDAAIELSGAGDIDLEVVFSEAPERGDTVQRIRAILGDRGLTLEGGQQPRENDSAQVPTRAGLSTSRGLLPRGPAEDGLERVAVGAVEMSVSTGTVEASVELSCREGRHRGRATSSNTSRGRLVAPANATLQALRACIGPGEPHLEVEYVYSEYGSKLERPHTTICVALVSSRSVERLLGSAFDHHGDPVRSATAATLAAVNRRVAPLLMRATHGSDG